MINCALVVALRICHNFLRAIWSLLAAFQVPRVNNLLLIPRKYLRGMGCVRAGDGAAKASLIVIVHLFLRFHISHVILLVYIIVAFVICHLTGIVQDFWTLMVTL